MDNCTALRHKNLLASLQTACEKERPWVPFDEFEIDTIELDQLPKITQATTWRIEGWVKNLVIEGETASTTNYKDCMKALLRCSTSYGFALDVRYIEPRLAWYSQRY